MNSDERVENIYEDQKNEENSNETSVRRLSLFDNISTNASSEILLIKKKNQNQLFQKTLTKQMIMKMMIHRQKLKRDK